MLIGPFLFGMMPNRAGCIGSSGVDEQQSRPDQGSSLFWFGTPNTLFRAVMLAGLVDLLGLTGGFAGGSGLNTVVMVNQASSNSVVLGNYYVERRRVPPENLLRIQWAGNSIAWSSNDFQEVLLNPLLSLLGSRFPIPQISYVVLSMDIPFQTVVPALSGGVPNSTTAALFYGLNPVNGSDYSNVRNGYAAAETAFHPGRASLAGTPCFLATMITADSLERAKQIVDQGADPDVPPVPSEVVLQQTSDPLRNLRYSLFDNAVFNARLAGRLLLSRTNSDSIPIRSNLFGLQTGLATFALQSATFSPGALADSMTSFGGVILGSNSQTTLLEFLKSGAAGSYGTVAEPYSIASRFPDPMVYFYQSRGFTLAESYYQAIPEPFLGLIVGDPLCSPFRAPGLGRWMVTNAEPVLNGVVRLPFSFAAVDQDHLLQRVDLFLDGKFFNTVTNVVPAAGESLRLRLNGYVVDYPVPAGSSRESIASNLVSLLSSPAVSNATGVAASACGDRIELRATTPAPPHYWLDPNSGQHGGFYRVRYLPDDTPPRVRLVGKTAAGAALLELAHPAAVPLLIEASTNLVEWNTIGASQTAGLAGFVDLDATNFAARFYRARADLPDERSRFSAPAIIDGKLMTRVESPRGWPFLVESSDGLNDWLSIAASSDGAPLEISAPISGSAMRIFRAVMTDPATTGPGISLVTNLSGNQLLRVENARRPFAIQTSADGVSWISVFTNFAIGCAQIETEARGIGGPSTANLTVASPRFQETSAAGIRPCSIQGTVTNGSWVRLTVSTSRNLATSLGFTNYSTGPNVTNFGRTIVEGINGSTSLAGPDGVLARDFMVDSFGIARFNLTARSSGLDPAGFKVRFWASPGVIATPAYAEAPVTNWANLQPRNHLYVRVGYPRIASDLGLDTRLLADGFHELSIVAYEGTSVSTQTRASLAIIVTNSPLHATLGVGAPEGGMVPVQVVANTNDIRSIALLGSGGVLASATNEPAPRFLVPTALLGSGLHPFFAIVTSATGAKYRTETRWVRIVDGAVVQTKKKSGRTGGPLF